MPRTVARRLALATLIGLLTMESIVTNATANTIDDAQTLFARVEGDSGRALLDLVSEISPTLADAYIRGGYGDLYNRSVLDETEKPIVAVAALTAMGDQPDMLSIQLNAALDAGLSLREIELIVVQMAAYGGFPRALDAMTVLHRVARDRDLLGGNEAGGVAGAGDEERYTAGADVYGRLSPDGLANIRAAFDAMAPDLADTTFRIFGDVYAIPGLDLRRRQIATVAGLAAMRGVDPQLRFHIGTARRVGVTREEIVEIMMLLQLYAGMPAAYNGMVAAKTVFEAAGDSQPAYE